MNILDIGDDNLIYLLDFVPLKSYPLICRDLYDIFLYKRETSKNYSLEKLVNSPFLHYRFNTLSHHDKARIAVYSITSRYFKLEHYTPATLLEYLRQLVIIKSNHVYDNNIILELVRRGYKQSDINLFVKYLTNIMTSHPNCDIDIKIGTHSIYYNIYSYIDSDKKIIYEGKISDSFFLYHMSLRMRADDTLKILSSI